MSRPGPGPGQLGTAHWALLSPGRGPSCSTQAASLCPRVPSPPRTTILTSAVLWTLWTAWTLDTGQTSRLRTRECSGGCRSRHKRAARSRPPFYYSAAPTQVHAATRHTALTHVPLTHLTLCRSAVEYHRRFCGGLAGGSKKSIYLRTTKSHNITRQRQRVFCVRYSTSKEIEKPQPQIRSDGDISAEDSGNASAGALAAVEVGRSQAAGDDV